jgi:universal stress protein E
MPYEPNFRKALVVLGPELAKPEDALQSVLLQRAIALARHTGCTLELFHVCYDSSYEYNVLGAIAEFDKLRREQIDNEATRVAEIAAWLKGEGVTVEYDVRWDWPRTDAILTKVVESDADVVMKEAREHGYVLGITSNTDWELARRSPVHVWFVNDEVDEINRVVAAVGNKLGDEEDVLDANDVDLMQTAGLIGKSFEADIHPVNACPPPPLPVVTEPSATAPAPVQSAEEREALMKKLAERRTASVRKLAQSSDVPEDNVHVLEGSPAEIIPEVAEKISADMILLGASTISRLERFLKPVTVEPVMARADCDIFVFRERDASSVPDRARDPQQGLPRYDLTRAITHPEDTFGTPAEVAVMDDVSVELRERILQAWEYDIRASMTAENEGGPVADIDVSALDDIAAARQLLETRQLNAEADQRLSA